MAKRNVEQLDLIGPHPDGGYMTLGTVNFPAGSILFTPDTASEFVKHTREAFIPYLMDCTAIIAKNPWQYVAGPNSNHTEAVRRGYRMSRNCPKCGAKAGQQCVRSNGISLRESNHRERMK